VREASVSVLSSGIVPNQRCSVIGFHQSASGLGGLTTATTSPSGPGLGAIGLAKVPELASSVGARPFSPSGVPGMGTEAPSYGEVPGKCTRTSSSDQIEGLNKSYVNTPRGVGSSLDPSRARASTASLFHWRI
jgi:hypothetical protein